MAETTAGMHIDATADATLSPEDAGGAPLDAAAWPDLGPVDAYAAHEAEAATKQLAGPDPVAPIRAKVRPGVEGLLGAFDEQERSVKNAARPWADVDLTDEVTHGRLRGAFDPDHPRHSDYLALKKRFDARGTLTQDGATRKLSEIKANRTGAVKTALAAVEQSIAEAEAKVTAQAADTAVRPAESDNGAAVNLMLVVERTTPRHGAALVAQYLVDAAQARNPGAAAAVLPMLKSLYETDGAWKGDAGLKSLIAKAERLTATRQSIVTAARLKEIARTRDQLDNYAKDLAQGVSVVDADGTHRYFANDRVPSFRAIAQDDERPWEVKRLRLTPEQRADAERRRKAALAAAAEE